ncbi:MAG: phage holin family protein [Candidatus Magasanikbacteria bacterium]|jgi:putative membrane protein|nr:phage holin family protein [Candidatus Magasanikbacteria bacterium]
MKLIIKWAISALTLYGIGLWLSGVSISGAYAALVAAAILALINAIIGPIVKFFTLPITILTLGLFTFVVNALLFWFGSTIVKGFEVDGFVPALFASLIMTIVATFTNSLLKKDKSPRV